MIITNINVSPETKRHLTALYGPDFMSDKDAQIAILLDEIERLRGVAPFIRKCMNERRAWANSPKGLKALGPGMVTIPGIQEYEQILAFVEGRT